MLSASSLKVQSGLKSFSLLSAGIRRVKEKMSKKEEKADSKKQILKKQILKRYQIKKRKQIIIKRGIMRTILFKYNYNYIIIMLVLLLC